MKQKLFSILALLLMAATGAMAQTESLLTTITPDGSGNPVYSVANKATIAKDGILYNGYWFATTARNLTVTACEGIVITKVKFTTNQGATWEDTAAPFQVKLQTLKVYDSDNSALNGVGVTKIEVYGYEATTYYSVTLAEGTEDADNWVITPNKGLNEGETVTIQYNGSKRIKKVTAVMVPVLVSGITLSKTTVELKAGETTTLNVTAVTPEKATDKTYTWSSSNEAAATVSQNGVVTAKTVTADTTVNITATANDGSGVKATCVVTVKPQQVDNNGFTVGGWNDQPGGNLGTE